MKKLLQMGATALVLSMASLSAQAARLHFVSPIFALPAAIC